MFNGVFGKERKEIKINSVLKLRKFGPMQPLPHFPLYPFCLVINLLVSGVSQLYGVKHVQ